MNETNKHLNVFKEDMTKYEVVLPDSEWQNLCHVLKLRRYKKRSIIFHEDQICEDAIFLTQGIAALEYRDGDEKVITRFFKAGNICTEVMSADTQNHFPYQLIAITDITGLMMPYRLISEAYLNSDTFGLYLRKKIFENHLEVKNFISNKTLPDTKKKYRFLEEYYPEIIQQTPSKYIAAFLGVTPEWISHLLRRRQR